MAAWFEDETFREAVAQLAGLAPTVLDIPCGIGRHALELARRGYSVTGVDRAQAYVDRAERDAAAAGLSVECVRDDMRAFVGPEAFDAVPCLLNSFSRRGQRFSQRLYGAAELVALLRDAGFVSVRVYGDLAGHPDDHRARALVAVARP